MVDFSFQRIRTDSVNHAHCEDIKSFVQFPGNSILKFCSDFEITVTILILKDVEFSCASFDICEKLIYVFSSQEIGSGSISFEMIFEALQSELFRFKFQRLSSKILKFPEFNLFIGVLNGPIKMPNRNNLQLV